MPGGRVDDPVVDRPHREQQAQHASVPAERRTWEVPDMSRDVLFSPEAGCAGPKHDGERFVSASGSAIEGLFASDDERGFECERPVGRQGSPDRHGCRWARS